MESNRCFKVRTAAEEDVPLMFQLINEMALYEKRPQDMTGSEDDLRYWICERKTATMLIAEFNGQTAGYAIYYPAFGSFAAMGKVHLEDIFLREQFRNQGLGKIFIGKIAARIISEGYRALEWNCLAWNRMGIGFYERLDARKESGREYFFFEKADLERVAVP
ncbi:MAG: GNAT family N-acetyltransferase [Lentisphaeria bacterium]|nr:GNAT family N-acetyltransferase [Lentisphaeria bacterium]